MDIFSPGYFKPGKGNVLEFYAKQLNSGAGCALQEPQPGLGDDIKNSENDFQGKPKNSTSTKSSCRSTSLPQHPSDRKEKLKEFQEKKKSLLYEKKASALKEYKKTGSYESLEKRTMKRKGSRSESIDSHSGFWAPFEPLKPQNEPSQAKPRPFTERQQVSKNESRRLEPYSKQINPSRTQELTPSTRFGFASKAAINKEGETSSGRASEAQRASESKRVHDYSRQNEAVRCPSPLINQNILSAHQSASQKQSSHTLYAGAASQIEDLNEQPRNNGRASEPKMVHDCSRKNDTARCPSPLINAYQSSSRKQSPQTLCAGVSSHIEALNEQPRSFERKSEPHIPDCSKQNGSTACFSILFDDSVVTPHHKASFVRASPRLEDNTAEQRNADLGKDHSTHRLSFDVPSLSVSGIRFPEDDSERHRDLDLLSASKAELAEVYQDLIQTEQEKTQLFDKLDESQQEVKNLKIAYNFAKLRAEEAEGIIDLLKEKLEKIEISSFSPENPEKNYTNNSAHVQHTPGAASPSKNCDIVRKFTETIERLERQLMKEKEKREKYAVLFMDSDSKLKKLKSDCKSEFQRKNKTIEQLEITLQNERQHRQEEKAALEEASRIQFVRVSHLEHDLKQAKEQNTSWGLEQKEHAKVHHCLQARIDVLEEQKREAIERALVSEQELQQGLDAFKLYRDKSESLRKSLHNQVIELRGNIRVFVRMRPTFENQESSFSFPLDETGQAKLIECHCSQLDRGGLKDKHRRWRFSFDHVFHPEASQEEVYAAVSPLVQSVVDGYRVCIFAYGQTGSGKTHTMMGPADCLLLSQSSVIPECGIIFRAVQEIFCKIHELELHGWSFEATIQMVEIYNEQVWDLLSLSKGKSPAARENLTIRSGAYGRDQEVVGLTTEEVTNASQIFHRLTSAISSRYTRATLANASSSRSHCIFTLRLNGLHPEHEQRNCVLNVVDLAGSERLSQVDDQSDPEVINETKSINKSLSALGNTIMSLARQDKHIPFRDTKLTHLLQHSLGGDCKVLMFCNISPEAEHKNESICSLRFAKKVNECIIPETQRKAKCQNCGF